MIYLDYAATTPVDPRVLEEMLPYFSETFANPSSKHSCGRRAARAADQARARVAAVLGCQSDNVIFTGSASEATNLALRGFADNFDDPCHFITTSFEHKATLETIEDLVELGHEATFVDPSPSGVVCVEDIIAAVRPNTKLISIIHVNNEIGTVQPVEEIGTFCKENGITFHVDATQSFGKIEVDVDLICADFLSISAHKLYGPKGVGALYARSGGDIICQITGGSQENGKRAGTLNVPGIVGLGKAAEISVEDMEGEFLRLRDLEDTILTYLCDIVGDVYLQGDIECKVPWITNVCFRGVDGETLRDALCAADVCVSRTSACAKSNAPSYVLKAIGCPLDLQSSAIRFSTGRFSTKQNIYRALNLIEDMVAQMRAGKYEMSGSCPF